MTQSSNPNSGDAEANVLNSLYVDMCVIQTKTKSIKLWSRSGSSNSLVGLTLRPRKRACELKKTVTESDSHTQRSSALYEFALTQHGLGSCHSRERQLA
jgi:hypothetical protein